MNTIQYMILIRRVLIVFNMELDTTQPYVQECIVLILSFFIERQVRHALMFRLETGYTPT